jgi:hypothetical protein
MSLFSMGGLTAWTGGLTDNLYFGGSVTVWADGLTASYSPW